ncbi:hypothetical protein JKG47_06380 [Acidithiobacillus sp. MC6.1]|nr:hypothetical protein [Acidithiobacillus sp. MC6.1]
MKSNIVRNILLSSASALALCAGPTMAVASTAPHFVPASPIIALTGRTPAHETVNYTIHNIDSLDPNINDKGTFRLTNGSGGVKAWTVHKLSTGKSYRTGYSIWVLKAKDGAQKISFNATATDSGASLIVSNGKPIPPKVPSLLIMHCEKTASLTDGSVTIPCGSGVSVTLSEKG